MAKLTVTGVATRLFYSDMGVEVTEYFKALDGTQRTRKYTAWFSKPVEFSEGASGIFTGNLSTKIDEYVSKLDGQTKQAVAIKINDAEFTPANVPFTNQPTTFATTPNPIPIDDMPF